MDYSKNEEMVRFIIMTNPTLENTIVSELIISGLIPEMIVTDSPFYCKKTNWLKYLIKKGLLLIRYLKNMDTIKKKYQPYFLAKKHSIPVYNSNYVNTKEFEKKIKNLAIDYIFTFGFRILKENIIDAPKKGCINFHPALLPFNRGATPSKWVILSNQNKTGITFHYINKGIDKGDIIEQYEIPLSGYENTKILNKYLFSLGAIILVRLIYKIKIKIKIKKIILNNAIGQGSYERPFKKNNSIISENNSLEEIRQIVKSSNDGYQNAIYNYNENELMIVNYIENTSINLAVNKFPFLDSEKNIHIRLKDDIIVMLITKKHYKHSVVH